MKFLISFHKSVLDQALFTQTVVHLLAGDTKFAGATLNSHYSEMNPAVHIGICIHADRFDI